MNVLMCLAAILFILMIWIGGKKGIRSFIALFLNFGVILVTIFFMSVPDLNPIITTIIASVVICSINIFYINEVNTTTTTAFLSSVITIVILLVFISVVTNHAMIQGFGEEEAEELSIFSLYIGIDFVKIAAAVIIMSTIGAITDTAIAIASPMREMANHNPNMKRNELFTFGLSIGRDILGSNANTLFFAFFGSYMALIIWFKDFSYSIGEVVNSKIFSGEIITIFCAGIGIGLIIPITAWITAYYLVRQKGKLSVEPGEES